MSSPETATLPVRATVAQLHGHARRWALAVTVGGLLLLLLTVAWNVWVPAGQRLDQRAFDSVVINDGFRYQHLPTVLAAVETKTLAIALLVCLVLGIIRRRVDLAAAALVVVVGANLTTYLLRVYAIARPHHGVDELGTLNSSPAGHATASVSIAIAIVLVTPMTMRFVVTCLATLWASWVGLGVIVVRMHRPGDVVAALAVVTIWAGIGIGVAAALAGRPRLRQALRAYRRQARGLGWRRPREIRVSGAPYGLTLLVLAGLSAVVVMGVLLVAWGVGVVASPTGIVLGLGSLTLVGALVAFLVGAASRAVEKYLR